MNISQQNPQAMKNPWVWGMLVFLMTFLSVNGFFIFMAFKSPPNLVVKDYYERGQHYTMARKEIDHEQSLGWTGVLIAPGHARVNQTQAYEAVINGKNSASLLLDSVVFYAYRPSDSRDDFSVKMNKTATGSYTADASFKLPGIWDVIIEARQGKQKFLITRRISILP